MNRILKNKKGISLVTVIIVVTVLVILSTLLMQTVIYSLSLTKRHKNVDYAYYAGESAIENWFSVIKKVLDDQSIINAYPGTLDVSDLGSRNKYANYLLDMVRGSKVLTEQFIDIAGVTTSSLPASTSAKVSLALTDELELINAEYNPVTNLMDISIGIKAKSVFTTPNTPYTAGDKMVYAVKVFSVKCPFKPQLESAVWTIGDFYINGCEAVVKGDVFTFGSHPQSTLSMRQDYYGGIYATNKANLSIYGNAYSRSFIRTGPYLAKEPDGTGSFRQADDQSEIWVYKDSIAQCLQAFGKSDKIITLRNAYTFDDIEINGEDSVIAVNGSFFGLSNGGDVLAHDNSSAIVNSAPVHIASLGNGFTDGSLRTRVVINGDVLIGGTTFKTHETGVAIGEIETASIAFDLDPDNHLPFYRRFDGEDTDFWQEKYHIALRKKYEKEKASFFGYLNQFQVWNPVDPFDSDAVQKWIQRIDTERKTSVGNYELIVPPKITGFSSFEAVANNRLYMDTLNVGSGYSPTEMEPQFLANLKILSSYKLDNIFDETTNKLKYNEEFWSGIIDPATDTKEFLYLGNESEKGKCSYILDDLLGKVSKYVRRDYPVADTKEPQVWIVEETGEFDKTLTALKDKYESLSDKAKEHMLYIYNGDLSSGDTDISTLFTSINVYDKSADRTTDGGTEYFIIVNADPKVNLVVTGPYNGIIVTAGKVILKEGASVFGSIIAAGDGEYIDGKFVPKAKVVGDSDVGELDKGTFAAVKIIADSEGEVPYIDFFLGMSGDKDVYTKNGLKNVIKKATETTEGRFLLPSGVDLTKDESLDYLNKAARINLLNKFSKFGINLYDIF